VAGGQARWGRLPMALGAIVVLAAAAAVAVRLVGFGGGPCTGGIALRVAASPEIASPLREIGAAWTAGGPEVGGRCVSLTVDATAAPIVASRLTVRAGHGIDIAAAPEPSPDEGQVPAVWIPDSTAWLRRVQVVDRAAFVGEPASVASTPVVMAMPAGLGASMPSVALADVPSLLAPNGPLKLGIAEPRRESASLAAAMLLAGALAPTDEQLPALVRIFRSVTRTADTGELLLALGDQVTAGPVAEQSVYAHNATNAPNRLVAVPFEPGAPRLDYPYAIRASLPREVAQAAELFQSALVDTGASVLARHAFRTPAGEAGPGFPGAAPPADGDIFGDAEKIERTLALWSAAITPSRTLALLDVTASMGSPLGDSTRSEVMVAAAQAGLTLFTADSKIGLWAFADDHQEVLPIGDLTPARRTEIAHQMAGAGPTGASRSELYATLLAAYQVMRDGYDPTRPNLIVVLTDGADSDPSVLRRAQFKQAVQRLADPTRPIRVVLIGIGASAADAASLQEIAGVVGGGYFPLTSPEQIQSIFLRALLRIG
jgi:Ca-activated chloride channel homolog